MPFMTIVAFAANVDQDQASQNVQFDLWSTLSDLVKYLRQKSYESAIILVIFVWLKCVIHLFSTFWVKNK